MVTMQRFTKLLCSVIFAFGIPLYVSAQSIITVAGIGIEGYTGDGGSPLYAQLHWPTDVVIDTAGNVYIADALNNVVRKIKSGKITTIAGTGFQDGTGRGGFSGDGGQATAARLYFPTGVAVDRKGNVFIADQANNRVRKIDTGGIINTIAGNGAAAYTGDGGLAVSAQVSAPTRVVVDTAGNIFIADAGNNCIRKIDVVTGNISTIAGTGAAGYNGDAVPANTAQLNNPNDVAVDDSGYVFIADTYNNRIRKIDLFGAISTIAGDGVPGFAGDGGPATASVIYSPSGIVVNDSGRVYFSQLGDSRIRKIGKNDTIATIAGTGSANYNGDNIPATNAKVWYPQGLALKKNGDLYIADQGNNRIRLITFAELAVNTINDPGAGINVYPNPAEGAFTLKISSGVNEQAQVVITNIAGEIITEANIPTNRPFEIKVDRPPGIYFVNAITAHGIMNGKLIVR
jgi:sugar lactone lactonase YvrE